MNSQSLGPRERALFRLYVNCQLGMSPQDFYTKWAVTHAQIAQICHCSEPTVDRWFSQSRHRRTPTLLHCRRLAEMDFLWESYEQIAPDLRQRLCPPPLAH